MKFTLQEETDKLVLKLELSKPIRNPETLRTENRIIVRDNHAIEYLNSENIKFGSMIKSGKNDNLNPPYVSEWYFEKYQEKPLVKDKKNNFSVDTSSTNVLSSTKKKRKSKRLQISSSLSE